MTEETGLARTATPNHPAETGATGQASDVQNVSGFLSQAKQHEESFAKTRPSRLRIFAFSRWQRQRAEKTAEIVSLYAKHIGNEAPNPTMLEETANALIKSTCIEKAKKVDMFRFDFESFCKVEKGEGGGYVCISVVLKNGANEFGFSKTLRTSLQNIHVFIDVPTDQDMWLQGKLEGTYLIANLDLHVHSREEVSSFLKPS
jgi:hypothetical protein